MPFHSTQVYFVLYQDMLATSLSLPVEMLEAANDLYRARNRRNKLEISLVSDTLQPVIAKSGIAFMPTKAIADLGGAPADREPPIIFLPGLWRNPKHSLKQHQSLVPWLRSQINQGAIVCAAGTGSCFLAETGLLNGKPATTHWFYFDDFKKNYPEIHLKRQHMITQAGKLYCAGSVNAIADLTVHLISELFDRHTGTHVERHFSHEARRPFENITFLDEKPHRHQDENIILVQLWLSKNFNKDIQLYDLSQKFDMSVRNFNRRFKQATGKAPLRYLQELRISHARELLKESNLSITEIAERVGYQDSAHFSGLFKQITQTTPGAFRKSVRSKLFSM